MNSTQNNTHPRVSQEIPPLLRSQAWNLLKYNIGSTVSVRGFFTGFRMRKCKGAHVMHGALRPQVTLAPVQIGNLVVDHIHIDLTPYINHQLTANETKIGDTISFTGKIGKYSYTSVITRKPRWKLCIRNISELISYPSAEVHRYDPEKEEWCELRNEQSLASYF